MIGWPLGETIIASTNEMYKSYFRRTGPVAPLARPRVFAVPAHTPAIAPLVVAARRMPLTRITFQTHQARPPAPRHLLCLRLWVWAEFRALVPNKQTSLSL